MFVGEPAALGFSEPFGLVSVASLEEALQRLDHEEIPVVSCDCDVSQDWEYVVRRLAQTSSRPCVVLLGRRPATALGGSGRGGRVRRGAQAAATRSAGSHDPIGYRVLALPARARSGLSRVACYEMTPLRTA